MQIEKAEHLFSQLDAVTSSGLLASIPRSLFVVAREEYFRRQHAMQMEAGNLHFCAPIPRTPSVLAAHSGPCNRIRCRSSMVAQYAPHGPMCRSWAQRSAVIIVQFLGRVTWSMLVAALLFDAFSASISGTASSSSDSFVRSVRRRVDY